MNEPQEWIESNDAPPKCKTEFCNDTCKDCNWVNESPVCNDCGSPTVWTKTAYEPAFPKNILYVFECPVCGWIC